MTLLNNEYFAWKLDRLLKLKKFLSEHGCGEGLKKEILYKIVHEGLQMKSKFGHQTYISLKNYIGNNIEEFLNKSTALQSVPLAMAIFNLRIQQSIHPPLLNISMEKASKLYKILFAAEKVDAEVTRIIRNITYYKSYKDALNIIDDYKIDENLVINYLKEVINIRLQKKMTQHQVMLSKEDINLPKNQSSFDRLETQEPKILDANRALDNKAVLDKVDTDSKTVLDCYVKLTDVFQCKFKSRLDSRIIANYKKKQLSCIQMEIDKINVYQMRKIKNNRKVLIKSKISHNIKTSKFGRIIKQNIKLNLSIS